MKTLVMTTIFVVTVVIKGQRNNLRYFIFKHII